MLSLDRAVTSVVIRVVFIDIRRVRLSIAMDFAIELRLLKASQEMTKPRAKKRAKKRNPEPNRLLSLTPNRASFLLNTGDALRVGVRVPNCDARFTRETCIAR
ncbi:hypothetical protein NKH94_29280 [Mesorhizobium australicum]|uniref:hypothetical protein n=1 Tax=Mesorhizobium australicum TaxID=536018 RepID=UPI003335D405